MAFSGLPDLVRVFLHPHPLKLLAPNTRPEKIMRPDAAKQSERGTQVVCV